jgi:hypothetical protein
MILNDLETFADIWHARNEILHKTQEEQGRKAAHTQQRSTIENLYTRSGEVLAGYLHLFHRPR